MRRNGLVLILLLCTAILFLCAIVSSASASTMYVPDDYATIQAAVDAAGPGYVIVVRDGTYKENVKVNKPHLTIKSENGADKTIVEAAHSHDSIFEVTEDYVNIIGLTIRGSRNEGIYLNVVHHCNIQSNDILANYGIYLSDCSSNNMIDNTVSNNTREGIHLKRSHSNCINNNVISNSSQRGIWFDCASKNIISNNTVSYSGYEGIYLYGSNSNSISNNTISHNKPSRYGIALSGSEKNNISNNVVSHNERGISSSNFNNICNNIVFSNSYGIYLQGSAHVSNNIVSDNTYGIYLHLTGFDIDSAHVSTHVNNNIVSGSAYGIYIYNGYGESTITNNNVTNNDEGILLSHGGSKSSNIITGNNVSNNTYGIRLFSAESNTISSNTANSNTYYGIYLSEGSSENIITKNTASNNYNGIYISESSDNSCYLNNFANNTDNVYSYESSNRWNTREEITYRYNGQIYTNHMGNYWGNYTGSDADGDGIGDMSYYIASDNDSYPLVVPWAIYFPPVAIFTYVHVPVVNQPILFDASYSLGQDGKITNYEWDFGDGNTTNTAKAIIIHSYSLAGNYTVNLTVTDNNGAMNSTSKVVTVLKSAPTDEKEWNRTFGGTDYDIAYSVQQTSDGGYIIAGDTESYGAGGRDVWLVKTDLNGNEQWDNTFGGTSDDEARSVQQTEDGGYILTGHTWSYGSGAADFWLVKTDSDGNKQWDKTFGGTSDDEAFSVQQTTDGGYILTGYTWSYGSGDADFWLVKTDSDGNKMWDRTFGGPDWDFAWSVQQTTDGGYILAGRMGSYGAGEGGAWLIKINSNGNEQWDKTFGGIGAAVASSVQQTSDGGYILAGWTTGSYGAGNIDFCLVKTDSDGNKQWNKTFGGTGDDVAVSVQQTTDGGYILVGETESYGAGSSDVWLVKTDSSGNEQWNKTFGGTGADVAFSIQQTTDGGYILAGCTDSYGAGSYDFWLIKVKGKG